MREGCGIFGVFAPGLDTARLVFFALFALQHRGQECAGIAVSGDERIQVTAHPGLVAQVFTENDLAALKGSAAIGHTCYSTCNSGCDTRKSATPQPILAEHDGWVVAVSHNGNITNADLLRSELQDLGQEFSSDSDAEVIARLIVTSHGSTWQEKFGNALKRLQGAYSIAALVPGMVVAARDRMGVRPLSIGALDGGFVVASETCAFDHIGATFLRDVDPGEIVFLDRKVFSQRQTRNGRRAFCVFEHIYFARPDSTIEGRLVYEARLAMGAKLADEHPVEADYVLGVPDSATAAAIGYARASGIPYREGLLKNRYVGRTFIAPDQRLRDLGVQLKFNPLSSLIKGKRLIVVDDSIVRGTTTPRVVRLLRQAGASEVHLRICAPPLLHPCPLGVDMASEWELIAARMSLSEIVAHIGADSLGYSSLPGLVQAVGLPRDILCLACFNGDYPLPVQMGLTRLTTGSQTA
ncbi:MAG: amidophosphoribosyltransferase [Dehalococcoidia bacterium]|jgi:amidophosphoribosyltransferase|nr:amidophosphoribosyltransferase [Dehalococcoidia bacterium]